MTGAWGRCGGHAEFHRAICAAGGNGDSHVYNVDTPLATGSSRLSFYGITGSADKLTRVTVNGSSLGEDGWLKMTTHSVGAPLTWQVIPAS